MRKYVHRTLTIVFFAGAFLPARDYFEHCMTILLTVLAVIFFLVSMDPKQP